MRYFLLLLVFWFYGMGISEISDDLPHGIHFIRQTDGVAFVQHYLKTDARFFEPGTLNLQSQDGRAACEFPVFYFFSAKLIQYFDSDYSNLRGLHGMFALIGLFAIFGLTHVFIQSLLLRLQVVLSVITCTVFNYYAFNYLPDIAAWGMVLMGYWGWINFFMNKKKIGLLIGVFGFLFAGLLKITYLIHPIALMMAFFILDFKSMKRTINWAIVFILAGVVTWWVFVIQYNQLFGDNYFTTGAKGFWEASEEQSIRIFQAITKHWRNSFFPKYTWYGILGMLIVLFFHWRQVDGLLKKIIVILLIGVVCYAALFWMQLEHHDYYFLNALPLFILFFIAFFNVVEKSVLEFKWKSIIIALFVSFTISSLYKAQQKMQWRMREITAEELPIQTLVELGLNNDFQSDRVWIVGEKTKNAALIYLNAFGYTTPQEFDRSFALKLGQLNVSKIILLKRDRAAQKILTEMGWAEIAGNNQAIALAHR